MGELRIVVEFAEGAEGGVLVGEPEQHELFEDGFAMGEAVGGVVEPLIERDFAAVDGDVGEFLDEGAEKLFDVVFADSGRKPVERGLRDLRIAGAAIAGDEDVADLVDEAHGEEGAGVDGVESGGGADFGHAVRELAAGGEVAKDDVADEVEERVADLVAVANLTGNVKFHHWFS